MVSLVCTLSSLKMERVPMLFPYKPEFVYPIVLIKALLFELGCGSPGTGWCITLIGIFQQGFLNQDLHHPLGILLPVGDKVEVTARLKLSCKKRDKITLAVRNKGPNRRCEWCFFFGQGSGKKM